MTPALLLIAKALFGGLVGGALGVAFFRSLATASRLYVAGDLRRALPLHLLRLGGAAAVFTAAALAGGAAALLGALAGFQAARMWVMRRQRRVT